MPKEQYPEINFPKVVITTPYFGNSAKDIENLITRHIEKEISGIKGLDKVSSNSMQDFSVIVADFDFSLTRDYAERKVKDAVDKARTELPNDLDQEPLVEAVDIAEMPVMVVNVSGDMGVDELRSYAEYIQEKLEGIKEVMRVDMLGAQEREVKINVDLPKMESLKVSFGDIENAIRTENITMSGGELLNNGFRQSIRIVGEFTNVKELESVIVKSERQSPIYLKDIATIVYGFKERTSYARADDKPVIALEVIKRSGENILKTADNINALIAEQQERLPKELTISTFNDGSAHTRMEVANLENSIISGVILVVLVLLFFLGLRNALFVGLAIPVSMLTGILWLHLTGTTLNIMVLFSLILALGLLVDNAIVVVENIYRFRQEGYSGRDAAKYGTGEVALPIIASTATTLAAFVPLLFWPGILGEFLKYLPMTLIIVLTSSLFVALVINPVFTSRFMAVDERVEDKAGRQRKVRNVLLGALIMAIIGVVGHFMNILWLRNIMGFAVAIILINFFILRPASFGFQNYGLPLLERAYNKVIRLVLKVPILGFLGTIGLLIGAIALFRTYPPKVIFFPSADPLYVNAFVELPMGKDIEETNAVMKDFEQRMVKVLEPYEHIVEAVLAQVGENTADPNAEPEPGASPNKARLTVAFVPSSERGGISTFTVLNDVREALRGLPGVQVVVAPNNDGPSTGPPISLEVQGENIDELVLLVEKLKAFLDKEEIPGIEELKPDVRLGKQELTIKIDREAARRYGVSTMAVASTIRTSVYGKEVSKFKVGEDEHPIFVRLDEKYRYNIDNVLNQRITFRSPTGQVNQVPISALAKVSYNSTYNLIKRKDEERIISLTSNVLTGYNANEIIAELENVIQDFHFPEGVSFKFTGEQEQQAEDMAFLSGAFLVAIFAIFIIIVAQFNSIYSPFIIVLSILFSTIGVFLGYTFSGKDINVIFTGVGIISLAGIVVNNAIVLIDYINLVVKRKREAVDIPDMLFMEKEEVKECIIEGGATRLRPVLLTAITTILSLIPLAIGFNFNFATLISELDPQIFIGGDNTAMWGPMSWTVIYGLVFSTFLTLVVVPVMYWLAYRLKRVLNRGTIAAGKELFEV